MTKSSDVNAPWLAEPYRHIHPTPGGRLDLMMYGFETGWTRRWVDAVGQEFTLLTIRLWTAPDKGPDGQQYADFTHPHLVDQLPPLFNGAKSTPVPVALFRTGNRELTSYKIGGVDA